MIVEAVSLKIQNVVNFVKRFRLSLNQRVGGSSPPRFTICFQRVSQRTEFFQLERALGIRIERVSMNGDSFAKSVRARRPRIRRIPATSGPRMVRLPGEFLQAQMEG